VSAVAGKLYVGCSGFSYNHWKDGVFYPKGLARRKWLEYYAERFGTVEMNVTFYRLPKEEIFRSWRDRTPEGFVFAFKGSRYITHVREFKGISGSAEKFMDCVSVVGDKLGPILWQTKPSHRKDVGSLESFIEVISDWPGTKHAFEFRHESWFDDEVCEVVAEAGMTVVRGDLKRELPDPPDDFSFIYVRKHGPQRYRGSYTAEQLRADARNIGKWLNAPKDVYVYFNNDIGGHAPKNALELLDLVEGNP